MIGKMAKKVGTGLGPQEDEPQSSVTIWGLGLTIEDVVQVARYHQTVAIADDPRVIRRVQASRDYIRRAVQAGESIYGVTSGFGGMGDVIISPDNAAELQDNLIWFHKTGAGERMPVEDVRAAMLLRANTLLQGVSGVRWEIIERLVTFLNQEVTPHVYQLGSIGASGDLVPLSYIAGALIGLDPCFSVDFRGREMGAPAALDRLGLDPLPLCPKEGLALINGTSVMTGVAANVVHDGLILLGLTLGAHALALQAMQGTNQSFHPFIHRHKPHPGQTWTAERMLDLLDGSRLMRDELDGQHDYRQNDLIQDRYSMRCIAQYLGPVVDGLRQIKQQVETEINSATDNPLIDGVRRASYHGGNFLGEYIGVAMDQIRYYVGMLAKHLDAQIALLVASEFNHGLPACLVGNPGRSINMGLKGLQLTANSIMPLLLFYGNSIADRYPTHAEQFNQNVNSQGFNAANLARRSVDVFRQYVAIALMFGVQAVDLRARAQAGHYDARALLSPATAKLYQAVRDVIGRDIDSGRPYIWNDDEQPLDLHVARVAADVAREGQIVEAARDIVGRLD